MHLTSQQPEMEWWANGVVSPGLTPVKVPKWSRGLRTSLPESLPTPVKAKTPGGRDGSPQIFEGLSCGSEPAVLLGAKGFALRRTSSALAVVKFILQWGRQVWIWSSRVQRVQEEEGVWREHSSKMRRILESWGEKKKGSVAGELWARGGRGRWQTRSDGRKVKKKWKGWRCRTSWWKLRCDGLQLSIGKTVFTGRKGGLGAYCVPTTESVWGELEKTQSQKTGWIPDGAEVSGPGSLWKSPPPSDPMTRRQEDWLGSCRNLAMKS